MVRTPADRHIQRLGMVALAVLMVGASGAQAAEVSSALFFEQQVQPILQQNCLKCHGNDPERIRAGLRLNSRLGLTRGGDRGSVIDFDRPEHSLLLNMISYQDEHHQMPPAGKLSEAQIEILTRWVKMGIPWDTREPEPEATEQEEQPISHKSDYWAYQPLREQAIPEVENTTWVRSPMDAYILAKLEQADLKPSAPGRKDGAAPARHLRSDRPAPQPGRGRRLHRRHPARCL